MEKHFNKGDKILFRTKKAKVRLIVVSLIK